MISELIQYLKENQDVLEKVQSGLASLIGINAEETQVILDAMNNNIQEPPNYWY